MEGRSYLRAVTHSSGHVLRDAVAAPATDYDSGSAMVGLSDSQPSTTDVVSLTNDLTSSSTTGPRWTQGMRSPLALASVVVVSLTFSIAAKFIFQRRGRGASRRDKYADALHHTQALPGGPHGWQRVYGLLRPPAPPAGEECISCDDDVDSKDVPMTCSCTVHPTPTFASNHLAPTVVRQSSKEATLSTTAVPLAKTAPAEAVTGHNFAHEKNSLSQASDSALRHDSESCASIYPATAALPNRCTSSLQTIIFTIVGRSHATQRAGVPSLRDNSESLDGGRLRFNSARRDGVDSTGNARENYQASSTSASVRSPVDAANALHGHGEAAARIVEVDGGGGYGVSSSSVSIACQMTEMMECSSYHATSPTSMCGSARSGRGNTVSYPVRSSVEAASGVESLQSPTLQKCTHTTDARVQGNSSGHAAVPIDSQMEGPKSSGAGLRKQSMSKDEASLATMPRRAGSVSEAESIGCDAIRSMGVLPTPSGCSCGRPRTTVTEASTNTDAVPMMSGPSKRGEGSHLMLNDRRVDDVTVHRRKGDPDYSVVLTYHDSVTGAPRTVGTCSLPPLQLDRASSMSSCDGGGGTTTSPRAMSHTSAHVQSKRVLSHSSSASVFSSGKSLHDAHPSATGSAGLQSSASSSNGSHVGAEDRPALGMRKGRFKDLAYPVKSEEPSAAYGGHLPPAAGDMEGRGKRQSQRSGLPPLKPVLAAPLSRTEPVAGHRLQGVAGRQGEMVMGEFLGGGACGKVYKCLNATTGEVFAAKQIVFDERDPKLRYRLKQLALELEVLALATAHRFQWIVGLHTTEKRGHSVVMYLEYCERGSLLDFMALRCDGDGECSTHTPTASSVKKAMQQDGLPYYPTDLTMVHMSSCVPSGGTSPVVGHYPTDAPAGLEPLTTATPPPTAAARGSVYGTPARWHMVSPQMPPLPILDVQRITREMVHALHYLHQNGYAHLDVKTANVLVTESGSSRLADFGCAMRLRRPATSDPKGGAPPAATVQDDVPYPVLLDSLDITELRGTVLYMAPEMIRFERNHIGSPADIWSLGCVVMEMATGIAPWRHVATDKLKVLFRVGSAREELPTPPLLWLWSERASALLDDETAWGSVEDADNAWGSNASVGERYSAACVGEGGSLCQTEGACLLVRRDAAHDDSESLGDSAARRRRVHLYVLLQHFVASCLRIRPEERSSAEELLQHPFLRL